MPENTLAELEREHNEWDSEFFNSSPGIIDRWEEWIRKKMEVGMPIEDIRSHLDTDSQTKLIHGAEEFDQHMIDHMLVLLDRSRTVTQKRIDRLERRVKRTGEITQQQAMALDQYKREISNIDRLTENLVLVVLYRDSKGRLTTEPTDRLAKFYRDKKGRYAKPREEKSTDA